MTTFFGAIADDFIGATDLAGLLARSGARVSLRIGVPADAPAHTPSREIIALNCRSTPATKPRRQRRQSLRLPRGHRLAGSYKSAAVWANVPAYNQPT